MGGDIAPVSSRMRSRCETEKGKGRPARERSHKGVQVRAWPRRPQAVLGVMRAVCRGEGGRGFGRETCRKRSTAGALLRLTCWH